MIRFMLRLVLIVCVACSGASAFAQSAKVKAAISAVKELCLSGTQFDLSADAKGNITFKSLKPGGEGSVAVDVRDSTGATAILDDKIRRIADEDVRDCMKPYIKRIVDAILDDNPPHPNVDPVSDPVQPQIGLPRGAIAAQCGCYGPAFPGQIGPSQVCASHQEIALQCPGFCLGGGTQWGTKCL